VLNRDNSTLTTEGGIKMPKITWGSMEIEIIENPSNEMIRNLTRKKFTGLTYYDRRKEPWTTWKSGKIVKFSKTRDEALQALVVASM